jgi:hypothetical protein
VVLRDFFIPLTPIYPIIPNIMSTNTTVASTNSKKNPLKKDAICLALVVIAVFILHAFSKSAVEQLYKTKEKANTAITAPVKSVAF